MTWADDCVGLAGSLGLDAGRAARIRKVQDSVTSAAMADQVDPDLINGVIWVESRFNPLAISGAGARGLMQLMPKTEKFLAGAMGWTVGPESWKAPRYNIRLGTHFLRRLLKAFDGREEWALAAYNAGPGNVRRFGPGRWLGYARAVQAARDAFRDGRLRCRGSELPVPTWGKARPVRPTRPPRRPRPPAPSPVAPVAAGGGAVLLLGLALAATEGGFRW